VIERIARGKFILGRRYYAAVGKKGVYTRKRGLDRGANKELLLKHIKENAKTGSKMNEFYQVLPGLNRGQIQVLLRELRAQGHIHSIGLTRAGRWYPKKNENELQ
jgi:ATP-dependent DNA helicase RecG